VGPHARVDLLGAPPDIRLDTMPARLASMGDLWKPLLQARGRFNLRAFV
jgi:hypothetical protein